MEFQNFRIQLYIDCLNNLKYIPCQLGDFRGGYIKYNNFIVVSGKLYIQKQEVNKTYYFNFPLNKTYNDIISPDIPVGKLTVSTSAFPMIASLRIILKLS